MSDLILAHTSGQFPHWLKEYFPITENQAVMERGPCQATARWDGEDWILQASGVGAISHMAIRGTGRKKTLFNRKTGCFLPDQAAQIPQCLSWGRSGASLPSRAPPSIGGVSSLSEGPHLHTWLTLVLKPSAFWVTL